MIQIAQTLAEIAAYNRLDLPIRYKVKAQNTRLDKGQPLDEGSDIMTVLVKPDGPIYRLDYDSHVTKWQDGAAAYFEEKKSVSFNGKYTSQVVYRQGAPGSLADINQAKIYEGISDRVFVQTSAVGFAYLSQMLSVLEAGSLEEAYQRTYARENVMWSVDVGDGKLMKVHAEVVNGDSYMRDVISFDRDFGGAMTEGIREIGSTKQPRPTKRQVWRVLGMEKIGTNWLPAKASFESFTDGLPIRRTDFEAKEIQILHNLSDEAFEIPLTKGMRVENTRFIRRFSP